MRKITKLSNRTVIVTLISFFLIISLCHFDVTIAYGEKVDKKVLFISSYNENFLSVPDEIEGIKSVLEPNNVHLDIEYMDTKRFDTTENRSIFYQILKYKLDKLEKYDAIIVGDDNALQFAMDYQDDLFKEIPIFFLGINDFNRAKLASEDEYITGVVEEMSLRENIEIGMRFNKNATKVVAIVDNTLTGKGDKEQFYLNEGEFEELLFEDINASEYTFEELKGVYENIEDDTILIYLSMYTDKTGANLTINEAVDLLREHTHVPIYRAEIGGVGDGILGGKMVSYVEAGKVAANMALEVIQGTPIETIDMIADSPNEYIFDYELIEKFNINKNLVPKDAILINKKVNFFEENRSILLKCLFVMDFLLIILAILVLDNMKRRKVEKALKESNEELTQTFEELTASEEELRAQYDTIQEHVEEIELLNQKYGIAIESTESAVWEMDIKRQDIFISKKFRNLINQSLKEHENINRVIELLSTDYYKEQLKSEFNIYIQGKKNEINIQIPIIDQNQNLIWILIRGKGVKDAKGELNIIHGIFLNITKMKKQDEYIEHLANHDYLTNLPNRMNFMNRLRIELSKSNPGAILLLDIDDFKGVNDTLGHVYGDKMLQEISNRLRSIADDHLFVSRFGGDEFLILIMKEDNIEVIMTYLLKLLKLFEKAITLDKNEYLVKFSIGITCYPHDSEDIDQLIMNADTAMYNMKNTGKNNYMFYSNDMQDEVKDKAKVEAILRSALKNDGFVLVYQPQVNVLTGEIVGFEALLRLRDYKIPPSRFIAIAEDTGLIKEIGRWVTGEAISQIAKWKEKGLELKPIAINFSSKQIRDLDYIKFLEETLKIMDVEPKYIEIEITESILLEKSDNTIDFLNQLKKVGMKIALDDFGTGYSSLNYLTFIPVDKIKLDKSLCEKFLSLDNFKVMDSLIALVHSLNLEITAEGIEEVEQYNRLKIGGCDYIQGYLFSKPLNSEDIEKIYDCNFLKDLL